MKIVGLMPLKNEADLLPEVLFHLQGELDDLFVIDADSVDDTYEIAKEYASYIVRESEVPRVGRERWHYHHLLEKIKMSYDEEVWVVITMGDRFFLNMGPRAMIAECLEKGYGAMHGRKLDFVRPVYDPWTPEMDHFPDYGISLRRLNRWCSVNVEEQVFAFKLRDDLSYLKSKYPWPKGLVECRRQKRFTMMTPFQEHQGRRSPRAMSWRYLNGSINIHSKNAGWNLTTPESTQATCSVWNRMDVLPYVGLETLELLLELCNVRCYSPEEADVFFAGIRDASLLCSISPRTDI